MFMVKNVFTICILSVYIAYVFMFFRESGIVRSDYLRQQSAQLLEAYATLCEE